MEMILFIGIQATGKSRFFKERFSDTHVRINMDMLRTRHREQILIDACLNAKQPFVVDNTNVSRAERVRYIHSAKAADFRVIGYYFSSRVATALERNATRSGKCRIPDVGILGTAARLETPQMDEGFDDLYFVQIKPPGEFLVEEWKNEIR